MTGDLGTIDRWLAVLAICVLLQTIATAGVAIYVVRFTRRAEAEIVKVRQAVDPLVASASASVEEVRGLIHSAQRADRRVRSVAGEVGRTVRDVRATVVNRLWPVLAAARAVGAAAATFTRRAPRRLDGAAWEDKVAEARFVAEGGPVYDTR